MKKTVLLVLVLTLIMGGTAFAALPPESGISPLYIYVSSIGAGLNVSAGTAFCEGMVKVCEPADISLTMTLLKSNGTGWSTVTSWSASATNDTICYISRQHSVSVGAYRVFVSAVITTADGNTEYASKYSNIVYFGVSPTGTL